jgi:hypothetical protein
MFDYHRRTSGLTAHPQSPTEYDIMKQMERVGKSLPMVVGSEAPTIIQPPLYKARFSNAMERYFMGIPNKWTTI